MVEIFSNVIVNKIVILIVLSLIFLSYKIDIDKSKLPLKISILNIILFLIALFDNMSILILIIIYIFSTFIYLQIMSASNFQKQIIKKPLFLIFDYLYKIIFKYGFIWVILFLIILSGSFYSFIINKIILDKTLINIIRITIAFFLLAKSIICCLNTNFKTLDINDIYNKINSVMPFYKFKYSEKLNNFSQMLIYKEDKSYFVRKNTYNLFSYEFFIYRFKRIYLSTNQYKVCNIKYIGNIFRIIITIYLLFNNTIRILLKTLKRILKYFYNKIMNIFRKYKKTYRLSKGYSTIEMQLIRTIAVKEGYSSHPFRRKVFEFLYSWIFFSCLKSYYHYYNYKNYYIDNNKLYKYYLIYLYINFAPVRINGIGYKNILDMYRKKDIYDITYEEFFVWTLGLSNIKIDNSILDYKTVDWANLDKKKLKTIIDIYTKAKNRKI